MRHFFFLFSLFFASQVHGQVEPVTVSSSPEGYTVQVDGKDFFVRGMNWGYVPIGTNYSYDLWSKSDAFIETVLHREMKQLKAMGVNAIRLFNVVPPRWVTWIRDKYGIYTAVNHLMGRYGFEVNGSFVPNIDYNNPAHRKAILDDLKATVARFKDVRGVLLYMLGNENNYGLHWTSFEIEALPGKEYDARAEHLYSLMGEAATLVKGIDAKRPTMLTNGDLQYLDLIAKHCSDVDIMGSNVYRGPSMGDLYERVGKTLKRPVIFSEFGADAYHAKDGREDHRMQADVLHAQWAEMYLNAAGQSGAGTAAGGFVFQWSDGWWKHKQHTNLDIHDTTASWPNGGYPDFVEGQNNMNEEWFGITAKSRSDEQGHFKVEPRGAYYMLQAAWTLDPYADGVDPAAITAHFDGIDTTRVGAPYDVASSTLRVEELERVQMSRLRMVFSSTVSGGRGATRFAGGRTFDHTQSFFPEATVKPSSSVSGRLALNLIGNVAQNRLNSTFYENRGQQHTLTDNDGEQVTLSTADRVRIYEAEFNIRTHLTDLQGLYRVGHYHWGDEGDLFGLYREAHYGPNIDIYDGVAPVMMLATGRGPLDGLKIAFGPEIYWGANPSVIAKYRRNFGAIGATIVHQEDIARKTDVQSSFAVPEPMTRKTTLNVDFPFLGGRGHLGGILAGSERVGRRFVWQRDVAGRGYLDQGVEIVEDEVQWLDTLGVKARFNWAAGPALIHLQGGYYGLVADGGPNNFPTGWRIHQSGRGNHFGGELGVDFAVTQSFRIEPKVLFQKPLIGPNVPIGDHLSTDTGIYYPGVRARNVLDDPFAVRDNRETITGELLLVFDPTPADWFWNWNRAETETASFASALSFVYRHHPTTQDARVAVFDTGLGAFGAAPPARDNWDITLIWVSRLSGGLKLFGNAYYGVMDAMGDSTRLVRRFGADATVWWRTMAARIDAKFNDWGPYDYHRDFNLTYPLQLSGDLSWGVRPMRLENQGTRIGIRGIFRRLDQYSEGLLEGSEFQEAMEMELGTYLEVDL